MRLLIVVLTAVITSFIATAPLLGFSLKEYCLSVYAYHPLFRSQQLQYEQLIIEKKKQQSITDWNLSVTPEISQVHLPKFSTFAPSKQENIGVNLGFQRKLWSTGGAISLGSSFRQNFQDIADMNMGERTISLGSGTTYEQSLSLMYTHPLLRNNNGVLDHLPSEITQLQLEAFKDINADIQEGFFISVVNAYLDWVLAQKSLEIAMERLKMSKANLVQATQKYQKNIIEKVDLLRSEDQVRLVEQAALQAKGQFLAASSILKRQSNRTDVETSQPQFELTWMTSSFPMKPFSKTRQAAQYDSQEAQLALQEKGLSEQLKPELTLNVGAGLLGGDNTFTGAFNMDKTNQFVSVVYQNSIEKSRLNQDVALLVTQRKALQTQRASSKLDFYSQYDGVIIQLKNTAELYQLALAQIESAQKSVREEARRYEQGRGQLNVVIQAEDNYQNAQLRAIQTAVNWHRLYTQYLALTDGLLTYVGVS